jgi:hypothetical protein
MTWATMVGVDGGGRQATMWVMRWAMTWATGTMAATTPAMMPLKGMAGTPAGKGGGGLLTEDAAAVAAVMTAEAAVYCRGCLVVIVKIFWCGIFMCGGNWQGHTSPHTLVTLEVCRRTFGWGL